MRHREVSSNTSARYEFVLRMGALSLTPTIPFTVLFDWFRSVVAFFFVLRVGAL